MPRTWPRWLPIAGWSLLGVLGAILAVFLATVTFGAVHGTEFCPQTFERRSYSYYEIPLIHLQMTGERHDDLTGKTEKCITSNKFIPPPTTARKDWHVLVGSRGSRQRQPGDAGILLQYLDAEESSDVYRWLRWSEEHAELAKVLWPAVQRLAVWDVYLFMPDLFELAKSATDSGELQARADALVAGKLLVLARSFQAKKESARAIQVLDEAARIAPDNDEIKTARAAAEAAQATAK